MNEQISTAVILAARREFNGKLPYPLVPIADGVCLLDRTLLLLDQLNYERIYIVTGYSFDLFEPYAQSDSRISIIYNPDYAFTSSMGSLARLHGVLTEDFLLIEGDTFYEGRVLEDLTRTAYRDCLSVTEESGSGDEAFVGLTHGFVTTVSKDRHQLASINGELLGIMRLSLQTFERMVALWKAANNPLLNYEYALLEVTSPIERPALFFNDLIWGDIDSDEDQHRMVNYIYPRLLRKENPLNIDNLVAHLSHIFSTPIDTSQVVIAPVGGMSNKNFRVEYAGKSYVLRLPGVASETMVDRSNEHTNSQIACQLGINPPIRYFDAQTGIKLADFIVGAQTLGQATIQRVEYLDQIAKLLHKLHDSAMRLSNDFNGFTELRKYEHTLEEIGISVQDKDALLIVPQLQARINELGVSLTPCHNDLVAENFIKDDSGNLYLIDWEYSGMNDPHWDIAALFLESSFSVEAQAYFLARYYLNDVPAHASEKIIIYQILMDLLWSLWTDIKEAGGEDFASYGADRYARALLNIKRWVNHEF